MRFKKDELIQVGRMLKRLSKDYDISIVLHVSHDKGVMNCLKDFKVINLIGKDPDTIMKVYKGAGCVIGMRLHSCVIPFGLGTKFIPLISHDKITAFLKVIGFMSMGVDITDPKFIEKIEKKVEDDFDYEGIELAQDFLYQVTEKNMQTIERIFEVNYVRRR